LLAEFLVGELTLGCVLATLMLGIAGMQAQSLKAIKLNAPDKTRGASEKLLTLFMVLFLALPLYAQMDKAGSFTVKGQVLDFWNFPSISHANSLIGFSDVLAKAILNVAYGTDSFVSESSTWCVL